MSGVQIAFGPTNVLLRDVDFVLAAGDVCMLRGPNGSGKTSFLRTLAGFVPPAAGRIESDFVRAGYVPQAGNVHSEFPVSVRDLVHMSFVGLRYAVPGLLRRRRAARVETILAEVGLANRADQLLRECSGGELQRAMIARALALEPDLLILDEPTSALDAGGRDAVLQILAARVAQQGMTIVMTSHAPGPPPAFVNRQLEIAEGRLREEA